MGVGLKVRPMAKDANAVRITKEAVDKARVAAAYQGISIAEYVSRVVVAQAEKDIEEGHRRMAMGGEKKGGKT